MAVVRLCLVALALAVCVSGGLSACSEESCSRRETCCNLPDGGGGCCPYKDGICCSDGIHCCPFGNVCDEDRGRCINTANQVNGQYTFLELAAAPNASVSNEHCPDGSSCPDVSTCCMTTSQHYGCCPFPDGVCCKDLTYCCPSGTHCIGGGLCYRPRSENDIEGAEEPPTRRAAIVTHARRQGVSECTDTTCAPNYTCCELAAGGEGCCPYSDAICCLDGIHCCPFGTVCDEDHMRCIDALGDKKERVVFVKLTSTTANVTQARRGGVSPCSDVTCGPSSTCCEGAAGGAACCPYSDAICCLDGIHCCPFGTVCDEDHMRCIDARGDKKEHVAFVMLTSTTANVTQARRGVVSPCSEATCGPSSTCCELAAGGEGCCPYRDAICCLDGIHCCPFGTVCDEDHNRCIDAQGDKKERVAFVKVTSTTASVTQARRGGVSACTDTTCPQTATCCELAGGGEGCCPYKDAICCLDGIHCCPFGTVCDEDHSRCIDALGDKKERVAFVKLTSTTANVSETNEHCPDGSTCPGVSVCCMTPTKHYGCCPYQHGVCCRDMVHCCPYGTHCIGGGLCQRQHGERVLEAFRVQENEQMATTRGCSGGQQRCGSDQTCCNKSDGSAACCPMKNAVCCAGMDSCCPPGFACSPLGCIKV